MSLGRVALRRGVVYRSRLRVDVQNALDLPISLRYSYWCGAINRVQVDVLPSRRIRQVYICLRSRNIRDSQVVVNPSRSGITLTDDGGGLCGGVNENELLLVLNSVE